MGWHVTPDTLRRETAGIQELWTGHRTGLSKPPSQRRPQPTLFPSYGRPTDLKAGGVSGHRIHESADELGSRFMAGNRRLTWETTRMNAARNPSVRIESRLTQPQETCVTDHRRSPLAVENNGASGTARESPDAPPKGNVRAFLVLFFSSSDGKTRSQNWASRFLL